VYLDKLDPDAVRVELYGDGVMGSAPAPQEMKRVRHLAGRGWWLRLPRGCISAVRPPAADYTPRVIPYRAGVAIPLEEARILWQR
jgi:glycogen phosphorylase